jgi:hypothetical protein
MPRLMHATLVAAAIAFSCVGDAMAQSISDEQVSQYSEALAGIWTTVTNQGEVRDALCTAKSPYWASEDAALNNEEPLGQIAGSLQIRATGEVNNEFWVAWNLGEDSREAGRLDRPILHRERLLFQRPRVLVQGMPEGPLLTLVYLDGSRRDDVDIHMFLGQTTVDGRQRLVMQAVAPRLHTDGSSSAAVFALVKCE